MIELAPELLEALSGAFSKLEGSSSALSEGMTSAAHDLSGVKLDDLQKAVKQARIAHENTSAAIDKTASAADQMTQAFMSSTKGTGKYASSLETFAGSLEDLGKNLGVAGQAAVMATAGLLKLAASSLKQNDALLGAYRTLSNFGNIDSTGTEGVMNMMHEMGATTEDVGFFLDTMREVAPAMTAFGGSVNAGSKKFSDMIMSITQGSSELEERFRAIGLNTEDISKYAGLFVKDQTAYGIAQGKSVADLRLKFTSLMEVTSELAELTGQSRDAQMEALQQNQRDARWRLHMMSLDPKEAEAQEKMVMAASAVSKQYGELLKDQYATSGEVTSQQTAMTRMMSGDLYQMAKQAGLRAAKNGTDATTELLLMMKQQVPETKKYLGQLSSKGFTPLTDTLNDLSISADNLHGVQTLESLDREKALSISKQIRDGEKKTNDERLSDAVKQERAERSSQQMADRMKYAAGNLAVPSLTKLAEVTNWTNVAMAKMLKTVSGGELDFTNQFKAMNSLEDVEDNLRKEKERETALLKEKLDLEKELQADQEVFDRNSSLGLPTGPVEQEMADIKRKLAMTEANLKSSRETQSTARGAYGSMMSTAQTESGSGALQGLTLKKGDVTKDPDKIDPKLIEIARKVQGSIQGFKYFSSFNDSYHQDSNSAHNRGRAFDFTLDHVPTDDEGKEIVQALKNLGATFVLDEYNHPSNKANAGHIHAQLGARLGGVFRGPESGYQVELHGHEAVVPMNKFNDFYKNSQTQDTTVSKAPLSNSMSSTGTSSAPDNFNRMLNDMMAMMSDKFDDMVSEMRRNRDVNEQILTHAKH